MIMNEDWKQGFPRDMVTHLYQYKSDHRLLLLNLDDVGIPPDRRRRPFRFQAA